MSHAPKLHAFLAAIREYPSISRAAKAARIHRSAHYRRYERDAKYRKAFDEAWRVGVGLLVDVANERVIDGIEEPVIYQGRYQVQTVKVGRRKVERLVTIRKYPERLHMALLRGEHPEKYNRQRLEHTGEGGGPIATEKSIKIEFVTAPPRPPDPSPDDPPDAGPTE